MNIPAIHGIIRRRILLNYRVDPVSVQKVLPSNFSPKIYHGYAIAGICLIRLEEVRPVGFPKFVGISSENTAHRFAVEWKGDDGTQKEGVYVPRRDTDSSLNALAGGRVFPGVHHHSRFQIEDAGGELSIQVDAKDLENPLVHIKARETERFPEDSVFPCLEASSAFFESGCVGYSSRPGSCTMDGLLLKVPEWTVAPLEICEVRSSYFDDENRFPRGGIEVDHALLMRDMYHQWHSEPQMMAS